MFLEQQRKELVEQKKTHTHKKHQIDMSDKYPTEESV